MSHRRESRPKPQKIVDRIRFAVDPDAEKKNEEAIAKRTLGKKYSDANKKEKSIAREKSLNTKSTKEYDSDDEFTDFVMTSSKIDGRIQRIQYLEYPTYAASVVSPMSFEDFCQTWKPDLYEGNTDFSQEEFDYKEVITEYKRRNLSVT